MLLVALSVLGLAAGALGGECANPKVAGTSFSTTDAFFHSATTFIVEVTVECGSGAKGLPLYALQGSRLLAAAYSEETGRYQVSWTETHEAAAKGAYELRFFDEEGYSAIRKAEREGGDVAKTPSLFSYSHQHGGPSRSAFVTSETLVTLGAAAVFYLAHSWRSSLTV